MPAKPSRTKRTSQKTTLKANSIRPKPARPRHLAKDRVTTTDVARQATSAALSAAKFEAIRRGAGPDGGAVGTGRSHDRGAGRRRTVFGGIGVVAMRGRTSV